MKLVNGLFAKLENGAGLHSPISFYRDYVYTANDYLVMAEHFCNTCCSAKLPKDNVAVLLFDDCPEAITAFLGCIQYGIVPVFVNKKASAQAIEELLRLADPATIVTDGNVHYSSAVTQGRAIIHVMHNAKQSIIKIEQSPQLSHAFIDASEVAYLGMTSGSSGLPKLVMHSHKEMLFANDNYAVNTLKLNPSDVLYSVPKMTFTYGLANSLFFAFASGAPAVLCPEHFSPEETIHNILRYRPTCFFAVPSIYRALIQYLKTRNDVKQIFSCCRLFVSAGELLPADLLKEWFALTEMYIADSVGCSETGSAFLVNFSGKKKQGSAGVAVPGYHLHLWKDEKNEDANTGVLCVKSESNAIGYLNDPQETGSKFLNGWLRTGDVFRVDSDGYYWFLGRTDSMLKYNGQWIVPSQIEKEICKYLGVTNCAVYSVQCKYSIRLAATIVVDDTFLDIPSLRKHLETQLEHYKCPQIFRIADSIPLNENGKYDYSTMRASAAAVTITIDGPSKMGKSTLADLVADKYGITHINAGQYFRFIRWCYNNKIIAKEALQDEAAITYLLNQSKIIDGNLHYQGKNIQDQLGGPAMAMATAEIAGTLALQNSVLTHIKRFSQSTPVIVEGRNMGADVFPDADLKVYLSGSPEKRVRMWCDKNGFGEDRFLEGVADMKRRNDLDQNRAINPLRKADDAVDLCADDKSPDELLSEISVLIDRIY